MDAEDVALDLGMPDFEEGWWRVRVTAIGRAQAACAGVLEPSWERYDILMWPEAESASKIVITESDAA